MKKIYTGLQRQFSHSRSTSASRAEQRNGENPRPPRRSTSIALLEGATHRHRRRLRSNTTPPAHFSSNPGLCRLVLTSGTPEIDRLTVQHFQEEGFTVSFLPYNGNPKEYDSQLQQLEDPLEPGDKYAIVDPINTAYGEPATFVLEACVKPMPKLCAVVAYYPNHVPNVGPAFDSSIHVQIHLAGTQGFSPQCLSFLYTDADVGFAERNRGQYDEISAKLAWSRALSCLRRGFAMDIDIESAWENHISLEFSAKDADAAMGTVTHDRPDLNFVPTMTGGKLGVPRFPLFFFPPAALYSEPGEITDTTAPCAIGIGYKNFSRFYSDFVIPCNPPSLKARLVSRTVGTDQIVDETHVSFTHTQEIPWMLPGVPPTDKFVEIAVVNVVSIRGGKVCHRQVYWDHASVLVQIGLLDPKLVPPGFKASGNGGQQINRLPVVGAEGARKVLDKTSGRGNELISSW
ncbi:hypothetical protein FQN54_001024 [Arachnomyces sp. PD_36]|nr:hypothetical protein FQN54_001024 [Arachnomyces sp. PD_36]